VWWYNNQDPMQFLIQPLLTPVVTCMSGSRWGLGLDLLTTLTYNSQLHLIIVLSLISTLHKSLEHTTKSFPACNVFTSSCLVTSPTMAIPQFLHSSPFWMVAPFQLSKFSFQLSPL
jgi:hypothetical protein